jgi:hypothetical protein
MTKSDEESLRDRFVLTGIGGVILVLLSTYSGFFFAKRKLKGDVDILTTELGLTKQFYSDKIKKQEFLTAEEAVDHVFPVELADKMRVYLGDKDFVPKGHSSRYLEDGFDYGTEIASRTPGEPYVVSRDEFMEHEDDSFNQVTLTFYAGDNVLADDQDEVIFDVDDLVGEDNLNRFGHGSNDPNVVYIRNERLTLDIEVLQSHGEFAVEVLGNDPTAR